MEEGGQIILLMDCNLDVRNNEIQTWINPIELTEVINGRHITIPDLSSFQRGSSIIDSIFVLQSLNIKNCGYLPFGYFPSDHRGLWMYIDFKQTFGLTTAHHICPSARLLISSTELTNKQISSYNSIIALRTQGMKIAEKNAANWKWVMFPSAHLWISNGRALSSGLQ